MDLSSSRVFPLLIKETWTLSSLIILLFPSSREACLPSVIVFINAAHYLKSIFLSYSFYFQSMVSQKIFLLKTKVIMSSVLWYKSWPRRMSRLTIVSLNLEMSFFSRIEWGEGLVSLLLIETKNLKRNCKFFFYCFIWWPPLFKDGSNTNRSK